MLKKSQIIKGHPYLVNRGPYMPAEYLIYSGNYWKASKRFEMRDGYDHGYIVELESIVCAITMSEYLDICLVQAINEYMIHREYDFNQGCDFHLYYFPGSIGHNGGIVIRKFWELYPELKIASEPLDNKAVTGDLFNLLRPIVATLPFVMQVESC